MGVKITDTQSIHPARGVDRTRQGEGARRSAAFSQLLQQQLAGAETAAGRREVTAPLAVFPVHEIDRINDLPSGSDLREQGIADTERLIDLMDRYHRVLKDGDRVPFDTKKLISDMEHVSREIIAYLPQLQESGNLYDVMRDSVVLARVEIEKYVRGDYG
ncbi:MAG: hypothetical protein JW781_03580 [Deltaproteobacteria bacterium]|nr:hypothetical protein [Candidatus Anaeroferrophillacea bacterium]